jgi:hypothetical protein
VAEFAALIKGGIFFPHAHLIFDVEQNAPAAPNKKGARRDARRR